MFDVGCEWLHSADINPVTKLAQAEGFEVVACPPHWTEHSNQRDFPVEDQRHFQASLREFDLRVAEAAERCTDSAAGDCLAKGNRWNTLIDAVSSYISGAELSRISVYDLDSYMDTGVNWKVRQGLGCLVARLADDCDLVLDTEVRRIDYSGADIVIETSRGRLQSKRLVCTVPTSLLARETPQFSPRLPRKTDAAAGLPLGNAEKVMLAVAEPEMLPLDGHMFGAVNRTGTGSYDIRPLGQPCIEGFFGGRLAEGLCRSDALSEFAVDELVGLLGSSFRRKVRSLAASNWTSDEYSRGSYSFALPGRACDRAVLAAPVDDRLFFAGEATSPHFFSTMHGAYETGLRAAAEVLRSCGRGRSDSHSHSV
jgi:monoamine oxidase